ncbi:MAG: hypothetical protein QW607_01930 [Desulfurococcaceae archaeon]
MIRKICTLILVFVLVGLHVIPTVASDNTGTILPGDLVIGGTRSIVEWMWNKGMMEISFSGNSFSDIHNQVLIVEKYLNKIFNATTFIPNYFLSDIGRYYMYYSGYEGSRLCGSNIVDFGETEVEKNLVNDIGKMFRGVTELLLESSSNIYSVLHLLGLKLRMLSDFSSIDLVCVGSTELRVYVDSRFVYIGTWYDGIPVGSPCSIFLLIEYEDGDVEVVRLGNFSLGYTGYNISDNVSGELIKDLSVGTRNGKVIKSWVFDANCIGVGRWLGFDVAHPFLYGYLNGYRNFIHNLVTIYRSAKESYDIYCFNFASGELRLPSPEIVFIKSAPDLEKLPTEVRIQVYLSYLYHLVTTDWFSRPVINGTTVYIVKPIKIVSDGKVYIPIFIPVELNETSVWVGYPYPLMGVWFIDGDIVDISYLNVTNAEFYDHIVGELYWIKDVYNYVNGVGVDYTRDGKPDIWSREYVVVDEVYVWDPVRGEFVSTNMGRIEIVPSGVWESYVLLSSSSSKGSSKGSKWIDRLRSFLSSNKKNLLILLGLAVCVVAALVFLGSRGKGRRVRSMSR